MAGSFASALLDELMGRNRDANPNDKRRDVHWSDPEVCKYFICGICPHDLFTNTRADLGSCTKMHDESIKREYQRSSRCERMGYEDDLLQYLNTVISEADKRIIRGNQRLLMANTEHTVPPTPEQLEVDIKIDAIKKEISDLVAEAESLGNEGKVEEAQIKTGKCDQLRTERLKLQEARDKMLRPFEEVYKRRPMEVCEICGAMLFIDDAPQRLDDHIQGKQHVGYARIRAYIAERQKKRDEMEKKGENGAKEGEKAADAVADGAGDSKADGIGVNDTASNDIKQDDASHRRDSRSAERKKEDREPRRDSEHRNRDASSSERRRPERDREHRHGGDRQNRDDESRRREKDRDDRHRADDDRERRRSRDVERNRDVERSRDAERNREKDRSRGHDDHRDRDHRHDHQKNSDHASRRSERSRSRSRRDSKSHPSRNESSSGRHRSRDRSEGRSRSRKDRSRSRH